MSPEEVLRAITNGKIEPNTSSRHLLSLASMASHRTSMFGQDIKAGDYWVAQRKSSGTYWPMVICDEEIVQKYFKRLRPDNARRPDGTWAHRYTITGGHPDERAFPCLFAGKLKCSWVPLKLIEPLHSNCGLSSRGQKSNFLLKEAWEEVDEQHGDYHNLSYWKDKLYANTLAAESRNTSSSSDTTLTSSPGPLTGISRHASQSKESRSMKGMYFNRSMFQDPVDDTERETKPKIKREYPDSDFGDNSVGLYGDGESQHSTSSKRSRLDIAGDVFGRPSPSPAASGSRTNLSTPLRTMSTFSARPEIKAETTDSNRVMIYVGNPYVSFRINRRSLDASPLLASLISHNPRKGSYIMSPVLSDLDANDFGPVAEYLARREYAPYILCDHTDFARLERINTLADSNHEVARCAMIYTMAKRLEIPSLQHLVFRKLKALTSTEPQTLVAILVVLEAVFEVVTPDMRDFLTRYVAAHFWSLIEKDVAGMSNILQDNADLQRGVFTIMAGLDTPETSVKEELADQVQTQKEVEVKIKEEPGIESKQDLEVPEEEIARKGVEQAQREEAEQGLVGGGQVLDGHDEEPSKDEEQEGLFLEEYDGRYP